MKRTVCRPGTAMIITPACMAVHSGALWRCGWGAAYTWHRLDIGRSIAFKGFGDQVRRQSDAGTAQLFGELGYGIKAGSVKFEPFAGVAYVKLHSDGFAEQGGPAALTSSAGNMSATFSTLGVHASTHFATRNGTDVAARIMLGWRHAFGRVTPFSTVAFSGGSPFTVAGTPMARDALAIEAGVDVALTGKVSVGVSYSGQIARGVQDHGVRGHLAIRF